MRAKALLLIITATAVSMQNADNGTLPQQDDTEVILNTLTGTNVAQNNQQPTTFSSPSTKNIPVTLLQKLSPANFFRPISEKLSTITNFFAYPYHPNFGGVHFLNPAQLLDKLTVPNNHAAIFGLGGWGQHDYPFAYRSASSRASGSALDDLKTKLKEYVETHKDHKSFSFGYLKPGDNNTVYVFPYFLGRRQNSRL